MIEEDLRAAFARHEALTPAAEPLRAAIQTQVVRRRRRRMVARSGIVATFLLVAMAALPSFVPRAPQPPPGTSLTGDLLVPAPTGPLNLLLIGIDGGARNGTERLADTIEIVHVSADRSSTALIALPRDAAVGRSRLSTTFITGGEPATRAAVTQLTGVSFDAGVVVDFGALRRVTDAVGGVEMCLDRPITSIHNNKVYPPGCRVLGGDDALAVLRARKGMTNGSYDRDRHAQRYLRSLAVKIAADGTLADPARLHDLVAAAQDGLVVNPGSAGLGGLFAVAAAAHPDGIVAISNPTFAGDANGLEILYPKVAGDLFAAIRKDRVAAWATAHPPYVSR